MKKRLFLVIGLWSLGNIVFAQTGAPVLPQGPLLNRAPEFSKWVVKFTYVKKNEDGSKKQEVSQAPATAPAVAPAHTIAVPASGAALPGTENITSQTKQSNLFNSEGLEKPDHIETTKTRNVFLQIIVDIQGKQVERWSNGRLESIQMPQSMLMLNDLSQPDIHNVDFEKRDFQGFDWISLGTFAGYLNYGSRPCLVFQKSGMTAYIDAETRLPVHWETDTEKREYIFESPPQAMLQPPNEVQSRLRGIDMQMRRAAAWGNRP